MKSTISVSIKHAPMFYVILSLPLCAMNQQCYASVDNETIWFNISLFAGIGFKAKVVNCKELYNYHVHSVMVETSMSG